MNWDDLTPAQRDFVLSELRDKVLKQAKKRRDGVHYGDIARDTADAEIFAAQKAIERLEGRS